MKLSKLLASLALFFCVNIQATDVLYKLSDFTGNSVVTKVVITPAVNSPISIGGSIVTPEPRIYTNLESGQFTVTNMAAPLSYKVDLYSPQALVKSFTNTIPATNGLIYAHEHTSVSTNAAYLVAYSQAQSDNRFLSKTAVAGGDLTGKYPNPTLAAVGSPGTYTKVTVDSKGRVTSGANLSAADIPALNYYPTSNPSNYISGIDADFYPSTARNEAIRIFGQNDELGLPSVIGFPNSEDDWGIYADSQNFLIANGSVTSARLNFSTNGDLSVSGRVLAPNVLTKGSNAVGDDFSITVASEEIYNFRRNAMDKNDDTVVRFGDFNFGPGDLEVRPGWPGVVFVNTNRVALKAYVDGKFVGVLFESNFSNWAATNAGFYSMLTNSGFYGGGDLIFKTNSSGDSLSLIFKTKTRTDGLVYVSDGNNAFELNKGIRSNGSVSANRFDSYGGTGVIISSTTGLSFRGVGDIIIGSANATNGFWVFNTGVKIGNSGSTITNIVTATATLDFPSIAAQSSADLTIAVSGAKANDSVALGLPASPASGVVFNAFVSGGSTVTVRAFNITGSAVDPVSATYRVTVTQF